MWKELIAQLYPQATFAEGASDVVLQQAEQQLGQSIPEQLASLLRESNGVGQIHNDGLIWSVERIVADNLMFRTYPAFRELYMPFDPMLFFADAGGGDQFALLMPPVDRDDVFVWNHEDDSRTWGAANVEMYLRWWAEGKLTT